MTNACFLSLQQRERGNSESHWGSKLFLLNLTHSPSAHISLVKASHGSTPSYNRVGALKELPSDPMPGGADTERL